ncbi:MAG TPA: ASKHA domain-containing protein [Mesotoga sp.]|nr:DUF4445 domain-containing protein [Mesotoga sp.]MDI9375404.1 ASKHA domain-containing protein [Thermotogota bacterium]NLX34455.1 DUF4445 domain-containing protein [Thermotogaceae bacterium]MDD4041627.1 ASKHA domain-containing protein [Mesotoga sp.]MDD4477599.1 ASKHA domain-containing protein [Mesotoga sp.]
MRLIVHSGEDVFEDDFPPGTPLLSALGELGIVIDTPCGGAGKCGKCRVRVDLDSMLSPPGQAEQTILGEALKRGIRLSCMAEITGDCQVYLDPGYFDAIATIDEISFEGCDPVVRRQSFVIPSGDGVRNQVSALVEEYLGEDLDLSDFYTGSLEGEVSVYTRPGKLVAIDGRRSFNLGVAVDIGTTTIATALLDLDSGEVLAKENTMNPQRAFGHDVISRITHTVVEREGLKTLSSVVRKAVSKLIEGLCEQSGRRSGDINEVVVSGNTTMTHLLFGFPVRSIATAPFSPFYGGIVRKKAGEIGLELSPFSEVLALPAISGYVGGDIVAGILSTNLREHEDELLIDLGTNGEIVVSSGGSLLCCSTAAGPAFEGGNIACGVGNVSGAIEKVSFDGSLTLKTIGGTPPSGICGSGLISIVSLLLKNGLIEASGRFSNLESWPGELRARFDKKCNGFMLSKDVYITLKDLRQFQLAKAALRTGIEVLLKSFYKRRLKKIRIAGGFGSKIDIGDLFITGILPPGPDCEIAVEGNTSLRGAIATLLYRSSLAEINAIIGCSKYIELSSLDEFRNMYIDHMGYV